MTPVLDIDYELDFDTITEKLADEIESLQPFGPQNPEPLFFSRNIEVAFAKIIGTSHLQLVLTQKGSRTQKKLKAIWFNVREDAVSERAFENMAFRLRRNYWNGNKGIQLVIEDAQFIKRV